MCMQIEISLPAFIPSKSIPAFLYFYLISSTDIYHTKNDIINEVPFQMIFFNTISLQMINHKKKNYEQYGHFLFIENTFDQHKKILSMDHKRSYVHITFKLDMTKDKVLNG